jgi:hypothetical protein
MAGDNEIQKNDQARDRSDGNAPGTWPGSGTTVEGHVETATTGIGGDPDADPPRGSASTSAHTQEPDDRRAERLVDDPGPDTPRN